MNARDILHFWFEEATPAQHFRKDTVFDAVIRARFAEIHRAASQGELSAWRDTPDGRLAEIIVLDQFSRNLFRDDARAFAADGMALVLAQEAIRAGADRELPPARCAFLYMPFMHSESRAIHVDAERLFRQPGLEDNYKFELGHKAIIDRFGRYPHRNKVLGRTSTPEELAFLERSDSSF
ncbi:MAG: sigma-70 family RNA polymerase sigma factor [Rhodanobacteraceae bacterium]|nr:MAG: sigma-70 family RNA polymerase sigma factor [Rhodanobacteraceae bacterium]